MTLFAKPVTGPVGQLSSYANKFVRKNGKPKRAYLLARARTEPVPATIGAGANSLIVMYWGRWSKSIWLRYGAALLGREEEVDDWADERDYSVMRAAAPEVLTGTTGIPTAFADDLRSSVLYPRNKVVLTVKEQKVTIADANRFVLPQASVSGATEPMINPNTVAITKFPEGISLVITPEDMENLDLWLSLTGTKIKVGDNSFDKTYDIYTNQPDLTALILTEGIKNRLKDLGNVRVIVDRGLLALIYLDGWLPTGELDAFAALTRAISRSAFLMSKEG